MLKEPNTIPALLLRRAREKPDDFAFLKKKFGVWNKITWNQFLENVRFLSLGMISLGLKKGEKVVFISKNRPEWIYTEMAAMAARSIPLGMYPESEEVEDFQKLISWSDAKFIIAEDQEQTDKALEIKDRLPKIERIIVMEFYEVRRYKEPILMSFDEVLEFGRKMDQEQPGLFEKNINNIKPDDIAILSTTSGTSALPKLVMIPHNSLISMFNALNSRDSMTPEDKVISSNPPAWIGQRGFGICWGPLSGLCLCFAEKDGTMDRDFREIGPTMIFSGPQLWDSMISKILVRMDDAGLLKKLTYKLFMPLGIKVIKLRLAGVKKVSPFYRFLYEVGEQLLYKHLRDLLGLSKMRNAYTGGGFLGEDQFLFFHAIGINLKQVYGGTEIAGIASTQLSDDIRTDTVGLPVPGVEIKADETGEIIIKSKNVMAGYYKNPEATAEALKDGWLYTSDYGYIDKDSGHLVMLDRKDDIITLNNGTKLSPQAIDTKLKFSPYIKEAICFGEGRDYIASLLQIDMDNVGKWAEKHHVPYTTFKDLSQRQEVYELLEKDVKRASGDLPDDLKVRRFSIIDKELDPEDREITHTRKLRRKAINGIYKRQIEALYSDEASDIRVVII